jgi:hypothetical protein
VKKDDQNPQFTVWLAAYGKRLIEVAHTCGSSCVPKSESQSCEQADSGPPITPKQD